MIDYIFFDLDGTLTDPKEGITRSVAHALRSFDIEVPDLDALTKFIGPPLKESFMSFYGFDEAQAKRAIEVYRERFSKIGVFENRVYPGIPAMLGQLVSHGKKLAVSTSKPWVFARQILDKFDLSSYFSAVVGSELDGRLTDKAEVIAQTMSVLGLGEEDKPRCAMAGDRRHDIEGAKKNGIIGVGIGFGYAEEGELSKAGADYIVNSVDEAGTLLLSL